MESLITSYDINFQAFHQTIKQLNGLVSGSFALSAYLNQEGIESGFQCNDIDIFIPGEQEHARDSRGYMIPGKYVIKSLNTMKEFLAIYGFIENDKFSTSDEEYYGSLTQIENITSFTNSDNKEIQIIIINTDNLLEYISNEFDFSACVSWYDIDNNSFKTLEPSLTKNKEMYWIKSKSEITQTNLIRLEKYISRGFKIVKMPFMDIDAPDKSQLLSNKKFDNIEVTDIFTLEDTSLREFLHKSELNIVLKAGETNYAFNRNTLMDYMKSKTFIIDNIGSILESPLKQCITLEAYYQFSHMEYSIYELKSSYSVPIFGGQVKSLFDLKCYSIEDWINNKPNKIITVPPKQSITENIYNSNIAELINLSLDNMLLEHAHLITSDNLEVFYNIVYENN